MSEKLTPINYILKKLDINSKELAQFLNVWEGTIVLWKSKGGNIPKKYHKLIIKLAKERAKQMHITEEELKEGGIIEDEE